jgi:hypothetical protein
MRKSCKVPLGVALSGVILTMIMLAGCGTVTNIQRASAPTAIQAKPGASPPGTADPAPPEGTADPAPSDPSPVNIPKNAASFSNIESMPGWQSCDRCAGKNGAGPKAPHSMTQFVKTPSRDGSSARFFLGGSTAYSNALWWKQLGPKPAARRFVYDTWFYIKNPLASQALEFDVNQALSGKKYIFGTECSLKRHEWDIYDAYNHKWVNSGVACRTPAAYTWHHLVWEFERTTDNKVRFVAITMDGAKKYVNRSYSPRASKIKELNVAFQMDGISSQVDYEVWLDQLKLTYW